MLDSTTEFTISINNLSPGNTALVTVIIGAVLQVLDCNFTIKKALTKFLDLKKIWPYI